MTDGRAEPLALVALADPFAPSAPDPGAEAWTGILGLARAHRVSPWIYRWRCGTIPLPDGFADDYRRTLGINVRLLAEARAVRAELSRRGIPAAFRKGMALIGPLYDEGERPCVDIDLYVGPTDAAGALEAVRGMGYRGGVMDAARGSLSLHRTEGVSRTIVDCHWDLGFMGRCRPDWRSVIGDPIGDDGRLTADAFAADLVGHLWHHSFRGLLRYLDIALLIGRGMLDASRLRWLCRELGMVPAGDLILGILSNLWDVPGTGPAGGLRQALLRGIAGHPVPLARGGRATQLAALVAAAPPAVLAAAIAKRL